MNKIKVGIIGATGLVGKTFLKYVLDDDRLELHLFASSNSKNKLIEGYIVEELNEHNITSLDYALFFAGSEVSKKYIPIAIENNIRVIDNSSYYRQEIDVPLVVPSINIESVNNSLLISNPNCSTIQCVVPLFDLYLHYGIREINYTTYQSVSGIGREGLDALERCYKNEKQSIFPYNIKFSCIPYIGKILANNYSEEEIKMINETKKIFNDSSLEIDATCVRVPIKNCHLVSVNVTLDKDFEIEDIKSIWSKNKSIILKDDPSQLDAYNNEHIYVGRVKKHLTNKKSLSFICVADNLTRGAAYNAYEILDYLVKNR